MTGLSQKAYLEVDIVDDEDTERTCVFEFREDLEVAPNMTKAFLIGHRGEYVREAASVGADVLGVDIPEAENRRGYYVDAGAGVETLTITATGGDRDMQWGDGSSDPADPEDVTKYDATGCDPRAQVDIIDWVISQAKTDSASPARLYHGQWADGTYADTAGAYNRPRAIAVQELSFEDPTDDPSGFTATIEAVWLAVFPEAAVDEAQRAIDELLEASPE